MTSRVSTRRLASIPRGFLFSVGCLALLVVWMTVAPHPAAAKGQLNGTVVDPDGQPVAGAQVTVNPLLDAVQRFQVETDEAGKYRMENFNPSRAYRFVISKEGYRTTVRNVEAGLSSITGSGTLTEEFILFPIGVDPGKRESQLVIMSRSSPGIEAYKKGNRWLDRGNLEKARKNYEIAQKLDPKLAPVYEGLALVYHRLADYEAALEASAKALELSPWDPDYLRVQYDALQSLGRQDAAREVLMRLAEAAADASTANLFYNEGIGAVRSRDFPLAISMLEAAQRLNPEMILATEALAKVYAASRKFETALALALEVLAEDPDNLDLLRLRQEAAVYLGRSEDAEEALQELIARDPTPRTATLVYNQGVAAFNGGDFETAEKSFRLALSVDADHLNARVGLAEALLGAKRYEECLELTEAILQEHPDHAHADRIASRARTRMGASGGS